uniref:Uncharacterized protein n=1 Tax=Amphimedon queenslandica TaxID=400682 RepID=A0A1X7VJW5_AMPQE
MLKDKTNFRAGHESILTENNIIVLAWHKDYNVVLNTCELTLLAFDLFLLLCFINNDPRSDVHHIIGRMKL